MHGKVSTIHHAGRSVFRGINGDFQATRYHSLTIAPDSLPAVLEVTANADDDVIMGVMHKSIRSTASSSIPSRSPPRTATRSCKNFLDLAADWNARQRADTAVA